MRILAMADYYLPSYRASGPIRTLTATAEALGGTFDLRIVTRDRDGHGAARYPGIAAGDWVRVGSGLVRYLSPDELNARTLRRVILDAEPDVLYLNSFFSAAFSVPTLILRRARAIPRIPVVLAPRGELAPGALALKTAKKRVYLRFVRSLGLCSDVTWQASSPFEAAQIHDWFGDQARVLVAPNLAPPVEPPREPRPAKVPGELKVSFLARLARNKNLRFALESFHGVRGNVELDIYGPAEDADYLAECQRVARGLPSNIDVRFCGALPPDKVMAALGRSQLFFLPTHGENFGHAIFEALHAGCPILVSDRTPWRDLEREGVGWDLSLSEPGRFTQILQRVVDMGPEEHLALSRRAKEFAAWRAEDVAIVEKTRELFIAAVHA